MHDHRLRIVYTGMIYEGKAEKIRPFSSVLCGNLGR